MEFIIFFARIEGKKFAKRDFTVSFVQRIVNDAIYFRETKKEREKRRQYLKIYESERRLCISSDKKKLWDTPCLLMQHSR